MNASGKVLAKKRLPEGVTGIAQLHELIGAHLGEDADSPKAVIGIETDRGPWVTALIAAGYLVFPVNPLQASRYRERHGVSGAKSDSGDAHMLADMGDKAQGRSAMATCGRRRGRTGRAVRPPGQAHGPRGNSGRASPHARSADRPPG